MITRCTQIIKEAENKSDTHWHFPTCIYSMRVLREVIRIHMVSTFLLLEIYYGFSSCLFYRACYFPTTKREWNISGNIGTLRHAFCSRTSYGYFGKIRQRRKKTHEAFCRCLPGAFQYVVCEGIFSTFYWLVELRVLPLGEARFFYILLEKLSERFARGFR